MFLIHCMSTEQRYWRDTKLSPFHQKRIKKVRDHCMLNWRLSLTWSSPTLLHARTMEIRSGKEIVVLQIFWIWWSSMFFILFSKKKVCFSSSGIQIMYSKPTSSCLTSVFALFFLPVQQSIPSCCIYWWSWRKGRFKNTKSLLFCIGKSS